MSDQQPATSQPAPAPDPDPDPSLDITSTQFNPLKALYASTELLKPVRHARLYDNVAKYETALLESAKSSDGSQLPGPSKPPPDPVVQPFQRKFQPHQLMLPGTGPKQRHQRNLLDRLASDTKFEGPLAGLRQLMTSGRRVRVHTRNATGVDGHLEGHIEMFDRHWNLALVDVVEVRRRRRPGRCAVAADAALAEQLMGGMTLAESAESQSAERTCDDEENEAAECRRRLRALRLRVPEVRAVRAINRKWVEVTRHLSAGVMVRGEQVVLVSAAAASADALAEAAPPSE